MDKHKYLVILTYHSKCRYEKGKHTRKYTINENNYSTHILNLEKTLCVFAWILNMLFLKLFMLQQISIIKTTHSQFVVIFSCHIEYCIHTHFRSQYGLLSWMRYLVIIILFCWELHQGVLKSIRNQLSELKIGYSIRKFGYPN